MTTGARTHKKKLYLRKRHFFVIEKYVEDVKQDEKHVPDLLESIMRPTCLVKEELRQHLFKMSKFRPKITKIVKQQESSSTVFLPSIAVKSRSASKTPLNHACIMYR